MGHESGALMNDVNALMKETPERSLTPSAMRGHSEKVALNEPGSEPSPDTESLLAL